MTDKNKYVLIEDPMMVAPDAYSSRLLSSLASSQERG